MPSIKKDAKQQKALTEISEGLATIRALNTILVTGWKGNIIINYDTGESGRNKFVRLALDPEKNEKEWASVLKLAQQQKSRLAKEIKNKAMKFAINLDKSDTLVMGPADAAVQAETRPEQGPEDEDGLAGVLDVGGDDNGMQAGNNFMPVDEEDIDPYEGEPNPDSEGF